MRYTRVWHVPKTSNIAPWLATTPGAEQALDTLVENDEDRSRILSLLELLRLEHQGSLPTKTEVRQAIQALKKAKKHVLEVARSMHSATERFLISSRPLGDGAVSLVGGLRSLEELEAGLQRAEEFLETLQELIRYRHLNDGVKALLVANTCDPPRYYDPEVSALVDEALVGLRAKTYDADSHKQWRTRHRKLIERARQAYTERYDRTEAEVIREALWLFLESKGHPRRVRKGGKKR